MLTIIWIIAWLLGGVLFANGIGQRTFNWFVLLVVLLWPISLLVFIGWMIALHFGWTNLKW